MIKTLKVNNSSFANLGSVQVQPKPATTVVRQVQQQTTVLQHPSAPGVTPVKQATIPLPVILHDSDKAATVTKPTLSSIASMLSSNSKLVIPLQSSFTTLMPTHVLSLDSGRVYDPRLTQGFVTTATKFQPYEQLTGVAQERPEIVMLTNFQPILDKDVSHTAPSFIGLFEDAGLPHFITDAGRYVDSQSSIRNLRTFNVQSQLKAIRTRYTVVNDMVQSREDDFTQALARLKDDASFLLNLVRIIESQKMQLDLRHDIFNVDPQEVGSYLTDNFSQLHVSFGTNKATSTLTRLLQVGHKPSYSCAETMVDLGYTDDSVKNVFSSSKVWLQLMFELRSILKHHTLRLVDIDPTYQRNDTNATTLLTPPTQYFSLATNLPSLPNLDELIDLQVAESSQAINSLQPAFVDIYQGVFFKNEEARIAAMAHVLTQEYRYSYGLTRDPIKRSLQGYYGYAASQQGNLTMFDSIVGRFGNNITDFPATTDTSLASIAQNSVPGSNVGVLTFETKYVEGDTGTLTPGGDFYFDRILDTDGTKFNTTGIDSLSQQLDDRLDQLNVMIDGFNLMALPTIDRGKGVNIEGSPLGTAMDLVSSLGQRLINPSTGQALAVAVTDRLGAVYSQARKDNRVKTILFLYTLSRISRQYSINVPGLSSSQHADNTPLVDSLIEQLVTALQNSVPETRTTIQLVTQRGLDKGLNTNALTHDSIKSAMKSGTQMTLLIEQFMSDVISQFRAKTSAIQDGFTRYGGYLDTIVMMLAFDLAVSMVARYSNQQLVGTHRGLTTFSQGQVTFAVSQTTTNHSVSYNELTQRLSNEASMTRQVLLTVVNSLKKLSGSLKGISNYLNSVDAKLKLDEVSRALSRDKDMLRMLLSEQQIMLLASTVENLLAARVSGVTGAQSPTHGSFHDDGSKVNQEITILDESDVPEALRDAVFGFLGTGDLASPAATNKRIMTVGIPLGFSQRIKQKVNIQKQKRATFENRKNDLVYLTVYKVDIQNSDIVYAPQRFMFELSRFPVRFSTSQWLALPQGASAQDIVNCIPTQCFTQSPDSGTASSITSGIEYASSAVANNEGVRGSRAAFASSAYDFLTEQQKAGLLHNHVQSQLLEAYIRLITGVNVAEHGYTLVDPSPAMETAFIQTFTEHTLKHVSEVATALASTAVTNAATPAGGVLFSSTAGKQLATIRSSLDSRSISQPVLSNPAGIAGQVSSAAMFRSMQMNAPPTKPATQQAGTTEASLSSISTKQVAAVIENMRTISGLSKTLSSIASVDALNQRVLSPKQFDRVFNVLVDPRDFEIDVAKTSETPYGKQALDLLIKQGDVVPVEPGYWSSPNTPAVAGQRSFLQGRFDPNVNRFRFRNRDKNEGDLVSDKYFVTIETFEDETT